MKLIAKGNTAEIYEYGENLICKMFYPEYPMDYIKHEFDNANAVVKMGIRTPKAYKLIFQDERKGILYDRIKGEVLSNKLHGVSGKSFDTWMGKFVDFHKQLMQHKIDAAMDYKEFLKMFATDEESIAKINALEDGNCFIHGDLHPGNIMVDKNSSLVLIDMMNLCKGPALYDVARTYFLLKSDNNAQNKYMERIGCTLEDIAPYLEVILDISENEMKGFRGVKRVQQRR